MVIKRNDIDVAAVGRAMYDEMREDMEANQWGRMVVIDVLSGDYEIADDDATALFRLIERRPDALTWGELVGYPAPYVMGFRFARADAEPNFKPSVHRD